MTSQLSTYIKKTALELGFDACGFAKAEPLDADAQFMSEWIERGFHADMRYLARNAEKRNNPQKMVDGCKSVIVTLLNYFPAQQQLPDSPKISKYAYSRVDYHTVIKQKLLLLENKINEEAGETCFNAAYQHRFVDSAPVLERRWAQRAGLGWIGKNKMLIHPSLGSFCFIGILFSNLELEYDSPMKNKCGACRRCLDACPTRAITESLGLDSNRCISYQTIEKKESVAPDIRALLHGNIYGCDVCNDVCPWNIARAKSHQHAELEPMAEILKWSAKKWEILSPEDYKSIFAHSAILRAGYNKFKENINIERNCRDSNQTDKNDVELQPLD